jgi:hypothetical protein
VLSRRLWLLPVLAALATLIVVGGAVWYVLSVTVLHSPPSASRVVERETIIAHLARGEKALSAGDFRLAARELESAQALGDQTPQGLTAEERRKLAQLAREAAILAEWESQALDLILSRWSNLPERDWRAAFTGNYQGKAFLFDVDVRRDATGRYEVSLPRRVGAEPYRLDLQELKLLRHLPLENRQRVLFAARLAQIRREVAAGDKERRWVVQLEPQTAVLLTDPGAVAACLGQPPDAELQAVLKRQATWVVELP